MGAAVGTAIADAVSQATGVISNNMPLVFGVAIAFVAWNVGKRVLGNLRNSSSRLASAAPVLGPARAVCGLFPAAVPSADFPQEIYRKTCYETSLPFCDQIRHKSIKPAPYASTC